MSGPRTISSHDVPESEATFSRTLQNGTMLEYHMRVLQQPERARACGQGAKAHADRRPVDPPPVVELRLFEGREKNDVTFSHNSNFFLFATLEQARPIAQGRGMPASTPAPVLTGVPVSGMAYLDRPTPAGYFIFPDLSVRHEGKYRLRFALYEETKEEVYPVPQDPLEPREYCTHRLDVKSKPFTVFSAKKFPGLAESTALSRIVAEQGCRVRIRRDVRMRRRNDRPNGDSEDRLMDETALLRAARRGATPAPDQYEMGDSIRAQHTPQYHQPAPHMQRSNSISRNRSGSDASMVSNMGDLQQGVRYDSGYPPTPSYGPPPGPHAQGAHQHLAFGNNGHTPAPPAPPPSHAHPPQEPYGQDMQPRYSQQSIAPAPVHHPSPHMVASRPQSQYGPPSAYHSRDNSLSLPGQQQIQHSRADSGHHVRRDSGEFHVRRDSDSGYRQQQPPQQYRPATPVVNAYSVPMENGYGQAYQTGPSLQAPPQQAPPQQVPPPQQITNNALPPLRLPALEPKLWNSQPTTPNSTNPPALPSPGPYPPPTNGAMQMQRQIPPQMPQPPPPNPNQFPAYYPEPKYSSPAMVPDSNWGPSGSVQPKESDGRGTKRPWGRVFNNAHVEGPMQNRNRPSSTSAAYGSDPPAYAQSAEVDDDAYDLGKLKMSYRRADGVEIVRRFPGED